MYEQLQVDVKLLENGKDSGITRRLSLRNGWAASFTNLPKYDDSGNLITYTVKEVYFSPEWSPRYGEVTLVPGTDNHYATTITNVCTLTYRLPETGGAGTHGYTIGGILLLAAAGLLLLYKIRVQCGKEGR